MSDPAGVAVRIARRLVREAVWHRGRCTWLGPEVVAGDASGDLAWRAVDPSLYDGAAGIGLSLTEIGVAADEPECTRTGVGALRHAVARAGDIEPRLGLGLYSGSTGIGLAAIRGGLISGRTDLCESGHALIVSSTRDIDGPAGPDLVRGRAGAIAALLAAREAIGDAGLGDLATRLGREIALAAEEHGAWQWPDPPGGTGLLPSGLSHGASGVAWALLELWAATGSDVHRSVATAALASEDGVRDAAIANWPGHRAADDGDVAGVAGRTVSHVHWCHGAPGIALARHRAWRLTGDEDQRAVAAAALEVTEAWVAAGVASARGGFCLCHGLPGNAEILEECVDAVPGRAARFRGLAEAVAQAGVDDHLSGERPWPCGAPGGESPGLMTGLAGIALFYMRRARPEIPSVLLVRPDAWAAS